MMHSLFLNKLKKDERDKLNCYELSRDIVKAGLTIKEFVKLLKLNSNSIRNPFWQKEKRLELRILLEKIKGTNGSY